MSSGGAETAGQEPGAEERVLLLTALPKDAQLTGTLLTQAGIPWCACNSLSSLCAELGRGVGAALVTEEVLQHPEVACLPPALAVQPAWSEIPFIVLTRAGRPSTAETREALEVLGNVTLLERPVGMPTLLSAVQAALRARRHQYGIREHLEEQARLLEEIRRADQAKDNFLAMLAHELRNPLAPILTTSTLLQARAQHDPALERHRALIERQARNMSRLVEDLLDVSRITRGKVILRKETVDFAEVAAHALDAAGAFIEARGHRLHVSGLSGPLPVDADAVRLEQVVLNLVVNAAKYTDPGGDIWITLGREADHAVLTVRDTGAGIPPDLLPHVFDLFIQAERTVDRAQGGLGIGLTTARHLVEMHRGTIGAFSAGLGRGSEFTVRLPLGAGGVMDNAKVPRQEGPGGSGPQLPQDTTRVLVVDDNQDAAETVAEMVECWGYEVAVAHSGPAALRAVTEHQPGIVLLDIGMPGMDGYEVARRLRVTPESREAVLVALTGYGHEEHRRLSREAGFDYHLVKPVEPEELKALLSRTPQL